MLVSVCATVHIISQLIYQRATRTARFNVFKDFLAQRHSHEVSARELSATFLTHMLPPNSFFGCRRRHSSLHSSYFFSF
jgi:hypothetical protein